MDLNLVPINQITKATQVDKIHLAYLTKLRLIPQTIRRKIDGKIMGCYPTFVIDQVRKIETLKAQGLSYSQIKNKLNEPVLREVTPAVSYNYNPLVYLVIGLVLGYVLFSLNSINNSLANKNSQAEVAAATLPTKSPIVTNSQDQEQKVYLIAVPDKNLYKLGQINFSSLVK